MRTHTLEADQTLPVLLDRVFAFFADAGNLGRITPPEVSFQFVTQLPVEMRVGATIEYRLRLFGMRFDWCTEITAWEPPHRFVDIQLRGPYRLWEHNHRFEQDADGTRVVDRVRYALPLPPFGEIAHPIVRRQLDRIFEYRREAVERCLVGTDSAGNG